MVYLFVFVYVGVCFSAEGEGVWYVCGVGMGELFLKSSIDGHIGYSLIF